MSIKKIQKNIYVPLLVLALSFSCAIPIFAQEETSKRFLQGATQEDTETLNHMESFLENVIAGNSQLFDSRAKSMGEEKFDKKTLQTNIEVEKVLEKRREAEKEEIEKRQLQRETETQENYFSSDIISVEDNNIKKVYTLLEDFESNLDNNARFVSFINTKDFFWYVPCSTATYEHSTALLHKDGITASVLEYREEPILLSNMQIAEIIKEQIKEDIVHLKYVLVPTIHLYIADVVTTSENEYIIPISVDGEEFGLDKGKIYNNQEFVACIKNYKKPTPRISETGEIADGTGNGIDNVVKKQTMPIVGVLGLCLGLSGLFVSKKI